MLFMQMVTKVFHAWKHIQIFLFTELIGINRRNQGRESCESYVFLASLSLPSFRRNKGTLKTHQRKKTVRVYFRRENRLFTENRFIENKFENWHEKWDFLMID